VALIKNRWRFDRPQGS